MTERVNLERLKSVVLLATNSARERAFPFEGGDLNPESGFIHLTQRIGLERQIPELPLNALFLISTTIFSERTSQIFQRITSEELLNRYLWLFAPKEVIKQGARSTFFESRNFLRPSGYNVNALKEWHHNCEILSRKYGGDVANFFKEYDDNAMAIYNALIVKPQKKGKDGFRRFGEKIGALFIQWVKRYNLYDLKGDAGVPVDFQVARVAIQTGGVELTKPLHKNTAVRLLRGAFSQVSEETGTSSADISSALYTIGSIACANRAHGQCPLKDVCTLLISRRPYDSIGVFDPTDTGRYKD